MGTKGITKDKKFFVRVVNTEYDLEIDDSEEFDMEIFGEAVELVKSALAKKGVLSYDNEFGGKIIIPYKILKKSIIKLIIV